jgi:hypothetical protein
MTLAIPTPPTSSATAPRPRNSEVNAVLAAARASSASDGREIDLFRVLAVGGGAERVAHGRDRVGVRAHVDRRRRAGRAEPVLGDAEPDDRRRVERVGEGDGIEDPDDREPAAGDPHPHAGAVDPQPRGGVGAEDGDRVAAVRRVDEAPTRERAADRAQQRRIGGEHADPVRHLAGDQPVARGERPKEDLESHGPNGAAGP